MTITRYKLVSYIGKWSEGQPMGQGKQFYVEGFYRGEFKNGKRHGKGWWETHDGKWKYLPVDTPQGNWEGDKMHGIGIIEDDKFIHENIIFKKGQGQMPFTVMGPPVRFGSVVVAMV